jgi:hypothetical protein
MSGNSRDGRALSAAEPAESDVEQQDGRGRACARRTAPFRAKPYPPVLDRGRSHTRTRERHMRDSAGRGGGLDLMVLLEASQSVPEADASAEQDRDHHDVRVVDEPGGKEVADHGGSAW